MFVQILLALSVPALLHALRCYTAFRRNLAAAKASNIPYIALPIYPVAQFWLITQKLWTPFLNRLPQSWTEWWLPISLENQVWDLRYTPFKKYGSDTLLLVAPGKCQLLTADAAVISQVTTRRSDFPKPLEVYGSLMLYGPNVVTTEGQTWRAHRKVTSLPFSEKNNHMVWTESILQAQSMVSSWMAGGTTSSTVSTLGEDCMRLSLHVISQAGFGKRLQWPRKSEDGKSNEEITRADANFKNTEADEGHTMSYSDTLIALLHNIVWVLVVPTAILKWLPIANAKLAHQAFIQWGVYLREMYEAKKIEVASTTQQEVGMDLMGALLKGARSSGEKGSPTAPENGGDDSPLQLTEDDIIGNAFIFILAGHETTANSIHFAIIYLAVHLSAQLLLQADLDRIFQGRRPEEWDYERDLPALFNSMANAVLSEQLRLIPPVVSIPKCVRDRPQPLNVNGKKCVVPAGTYVSLLTVNAHRNPKYWPMGPPSEPEHPIHETSNTDNDLEEFKPERWFMNTKKDKVPNDEHGDKADSHLENPTTLYRPCHGAYVPFSAGARSCLGQRFAQVEVLAVLATIFSQYSVELALDDFANEEELTNMNDEVRKATWDKAKYNVHRVLREKMQSIFTLKLAGADIKVKFSRREI